MAERVFSLPDLGEGLEEAVVIAWLVAEGEIVELNQPFAEIETAKATVEIPSPFAGRIAKLHVEAGATLAVGAPLVTFEIEGFEAGGSPSHSATATPAVRRLAKDRGIDLSSVAGTGPEGRVTREDVERSSSGPSDNGEPELVPVTSVRRAIARNLEEISRIPQVTTFRTVDCMELEALRSELDVSPLPVFVRALAEICHEHPWINASWADEGIQLHHLVHVGVATDTDRGLVVPVLRDAGSLTIGAIAAEIARLAGAARA
ncbi:MAG: dihydrolipoamide acetyltransferase family protein, partial [Actinomycetota bacterium]